MAAVDAGVEETRMRRGVGLRCKLGSIHQVVMPVSLFVTFHRIEEVRRFLRASQLGNAVERDHGALHPLAPKRVTISDGALPKIQRLPAPPRYREPPALLAKRSDRYCVRSRRTGNQTSHQTAAFVGPAGNNSPTESVQSALQTCRANPLDGVD